MAKLIADTEEGTITLEVNPDKDAPKFAQGKPVVYCGELTPENMEEAKDFFLMEQLRELEEIDTTGKSLEDTEENQE